MAKRYILFVLILICCVNISYSDSGIPGKIGSWRVEVSSAGNEFYGLPQYMINPNPPTDEMVQLVKEIAPLYTVIKRWKALKDNRYFIRAESGPEEYDFIVTTDGIICEIDYENDSTKVEERADNLLLKGSKQEISPDSIPDKTLTILAKLYPNEKPVRQWTAKTVAGKRVVIEIGEMAFYVRPDGQIQAADRIKDGALDEIDPAQQIKRSFKQVEKASKELLSSYREKFNFENQINELSRKTAAKDGSFRFVVIGDSRSNEDLWSSIIRHIDMLSPKPEFAIITGDIVPHGYAEEYYSYYIPPLLNTAIPYFVAIGNHDNGFRGRNYEYKYLFGEHSLNYYFDFGTYRFLFMDNVTRGVPFHVNFQWLKKVLQKTPAAKKTIVITHRPAATIEKWGYHSMNEYDSNQFTALMTKQNVEHVFFGHIHAYSTAIHNGVDYTVTGGGGAGLHNRFGPLGNVHHYIICDVEADGSLKQTVVRFYSTTEQE